MSMATRRLQVVVIGDGPAAMATAIGLMLGGAAVRCTQPLAARAGSGFVPRPADSLSPTGHALLRRLGVAEAFAADGYLPCPAHASDWGPGGLHRFDFLSHPQGQAWHVDRRRFDARLRARALALGAVFDLPAQGWQPRGLGTQRIGRGEGGWQLPGGTAHAIVDGSGRSSHFARRQGRCRLRGDRQIAWLTSAPAADAQGDLSTLVEATAEGWWYSAPAPGGRWGLACFTDADLRPRDRGPAGWLQRLADAPRTLDRLIDHGVDPQALARQPGRLQPADSARLDRFTGEAWLAVGDAAMSYDPLSAHGLTVALRSGLDAAQALLARHQGDTQAMAAYAGRLARGFDAYREERRTRYRDETRHAAHRFWQRRQAAGPDLASCT